MHRALAPSYALDDLIGLTLQSTSGSMALLVESCDKVDLDLYRWIHELITLTSSNAIYEPKKPFQDPEVRKGPSKPMMQKIQKSESFTSTDLLTNTGQWRVILQSYLPTLPPSGRHQKPTKDVGMSSKHFERITLTAAVSKVLARQVSLLRYREKSYAFHRHGQIRAFWALWHVGHYRTKHILGYS